MHLHVCVFAVCVYLCLCVALVCQTKRDCVDSNDLMLHSSVHYSNGMIKMDTCGLNGYLRPESKRMPYAVNSFVRLKTMMRV